ncbi:hypothetical protein SAMN04488689_11036 [Paenibacillus sp. cl6col]|nr:hypothetical protein SAMN04488689_11036 [Paenibacillus sp. cl6col]
MINKWISSQNSAQVFDCKSDTAIVVKHPMEKRERPVAIAVPFFF